MSEDNSNSNSEIDWKSASPEILNNRNVMVAALEKNPDVIRFLPETIATEFADLAIRKDSTENKQTAKPAIKNTAKFKA